MYFKIGSLSFLSKFFKLCLDDLCSSIKTFKPNNQAKQELASVP